MGPHDLQRADRLNRLWDAQVLGRAPTDPAIADHDHDDAAVIARLQALGDPPDRDVARDRVWRELQEHHRWKEPDVQPILMSANHAAPQPIVTIPGLRPSSPNAPLRQDWRRHPPWAWGQLATAALLLLTLVTSVVAFGWMRSAPDERSASLPALMATPSSEAALETVFATTLPAALIPTAPGDRTFDIWSAVLAPGERVPIPGQSPGTQITHVVAGELTIRVSGSLQVFRGADVASGAGAMPSGTEVVLHPGDTAVYAYETAAEYANLGASPVQIVGGQLSVGGVPGGSVPLNILDYSEKYPLPAPPPGPVQATLVRATLPPKGVAPAPPAGAVVMQVSASEDVSIGENSDGSLRNIGSREATIYVLTLTPIGAAPGTPAT